MLVFRFYLELHFYSKVKARPMGLLAGVSPRRCVRNDGVSDLLPSYTIGDVLDFQGFAYNAPGSRLFHEFNKYFEARIRPIWITLPIV